MNLASSVGLSTKPSLPCLHSLLNSYIESRNRKQALLLFRQLLEYNVKPNDLTFSLLLKACTSSSSSSSSPALNSLNVKREANQIHTHLLKSGVDRFMYVSTALLDLYMKLGCVRNAHRLFDDMPDRDVVSWNALICGFSRNGCDFEALKLFVQMCKEGFFPHQTTLVSLVPSCDLEAAEHLFEEIVEKSVVSWNTMIGAYGQNGFFDEAVLAFKRMQEENVPANLVTMVSLLSANADPESTHCHATKTGLVNDASVITSLICQYATRRNTESGKLLYKSLPQKNLVSLTALMSSYTEKGDLFQVMSCFAHLQQLEMKLDAVAMVCILHGMKDPMDFRLGLAFHAYGLKSGLSADSLVANGLISLYSRFDKIETAFSLLSEIHEKTLISWNSLISGCVQAGRPSDALEVFFQMKMSGHSPDAITISSLLSGCCQLGYLQFGERLHNYILRNNLEVEDFVGTALIDMYIKCGRIEHAERVFKSIEEPCLATWNSMISGYSLYGLEHEALACFSEMQKQGIKPDKITFLGVLAACTHGGLVQEGRKHFQIMREQFNMVPDLQHYACMVGLFGRAGLFEEALMFIRNMEMEPDFAVWATLLSACCIHQEVKLGEYVARKLFFLDSNNGGFFVLMSNLYAVKGMWDEVARVREMMRESGGDGCSGISVIEMTSLEDMNVNLSSSKSSLNANAWQPLLSLY
ncbi:PREDICTED: pentatricopeptide [Prunus dulcis]|uniref:PREDICTED: pentatricopeptide n=1 Tax=Prunus dulcis TaxID=3755 RepID=A0A5E4E8I0_PRUDU|nr:PREDICTED: pentatricopeptide [Prunus dulcis]